MYRCDFCGTVVSPKVRCNRVVTKTRRREYPFRRKANPGFVKKGGQRTMLRSNRNSDRIDDRGGSGWEIAHESKCCPQCLNKRASL